MKIYRTLVINTETFERLLEDSYEYCGPVWLAKGDDAAKANEEAQTAFNEQLMSQQATEFGQSQSQYNYLKGILTPQIDNPQGMSQPALTAAQTQATDTTAQTYRGAQVAQQNQEAARNGADLPSGVQAQLAAETQASAAGAQSQAQENITLQNEQLKQQNYWNSINALGGAGAQVNEGGVAAAGAVASGGNTTANLSQAVTASQQTPWLNSLLGAAGAVGSGWATGGFKT